MQQDSSTSRIDRMFSELLFTMHFYTSMILGGWFFHTFIYPFAYFSKAAPSLALQLPIYAANVLAFGATVYVATRPLILLGIEILRAIDYALQKFFASRN